MLAIQPFIFNPFYENTYVVYNASGEAFLIDPGNQTPEETRQLSDFIEEHHLKIKYNLLTHAHIDHIMGLQWAYDTYQVPVLMHEADREILEMCSLTAQKYGGQMAVPQVAIDYLKEGDKLQLGEAVLEVLHLPGHSPGSIGFYHPAAHWIISGDVLFQGSIGRTDLYKGDYHQLIDSIKSKLLNLAPQTQVFSGHGEETTIGFEKQHNPFLAD